MEGEDGLTEQFRGTVEDSKVWRTGEEYLARLGFVTSNQREGDSLKYGYVDVGEGKPAIIPYTLERRTIFHREKKPSIEEIRQKFEGKTILNVGSGGKGLEDYFRRNKINAKMVSLDPSYKDTPEFYRQLASEATNPVFGRTKEERANIRNLASGKTRKALSGNSIAASGEQLPFKDESFDYIVALFSLPSWSTDMSVIREFCLEAQRVLKPNGELRISPFSVQLGLKADTVGDLFRPGGQAIPVTRVTAWPRLQEELSAKFDMFFDFPYKSYPQLATTAIFRKKV